MNIKLLLSVGAFLCTGFLSAATQQPDSIITSTPDNDLKGAEYFTYDADGNCTFYEQWGYGWGDVIHSVYTCTTAYQNGVRSVYYTQDDWGDAIWHFCDALGRDTLVCDTVPTAAQLGYIEQTRYAYNELGQMISKIIVRQEDEYSTYDPYSSQTYTYNAQGLVSTVASVSTEYGNTNEAYTYQFQGDSLKKTTITTTRGENVSVTTTERFFDTQNRDTAIMEISDATSDSPWYMLSVRTFDAAGNLTSLKTYRSDANFARINGSSAEYWTYDANGNLASYLIPSVSGNVETPDQKKLYSYGANWNLATIENYTWDVWNETDEDKYYLESTTRYYPACQTAISNVQISNAEVLTQGRQITIENAAGNTLSLYNMAGQCIFSATHLSDSYMFAVPVSGVYILRIGTDTVKLMIP